MEITRCPNGHFYDAEKCATCPTCANENGSQPFTFGDGMGASYNPMPTAPTASEYGATEPISGGFAGGPSMGAQMPPQSMMQTSAFVETKADSFPKTVPVEDGAGKAGAGNGVEDYGQTMPVGMGPSGAQAKTNAASDFIPPFSTTPVPPTNAVFNPVTGWLVCIDGPSKGTDYRIRSQYNYIGRAKHMDICISGDEYISAEKAAILAYDDMEKKFFIAPGMGHNLVRLNGRMVMGSEMLNPYDKIVIGKTTLVFVPLCGEQFDWKEC